MVETYLRPDTPEEAVRARAELGSGARFLAGGTWLNARDCTDRAEHLVSLERLGLDRIEEAGGALRIGAGATIQQIIETPGMPEPIRAAGRNIQNRNIRNQATLGGQLGSGRSCGDLVPVLAALEGTVEVLRPTGAKERLPVLSYLEAPEKDLVLHIALSREGPPRHVALDRFARSFGCIAALTVAVSFRKGEGELEGVIIALGGLAPYVIRLGQAEQALAGAPLPPLSKVEALVSREIQAPADIQASGAFKAHLGGVLAARCLYRADRGEGWVWPC